LDSSSVELREVLGRKTLIIGEAGAGKSRMLVDILNTLRHNGYASQVTVIDLAPPKLGNIGGPLTLHTNVDDIRYLRPEHVYAPRLQACNADDLRRYVEHNVSQARLLFDVYLRETSSVLMMNDLTIFLHGGTLQELLDVIGRAGTFVGTAYYGTALTEDYGTSLTARERRLVEGLMASVDSTVRL